METSADVRFLLVRYIHDMHSQVLSKGGPIYGSVIMYCLPRSFKKTIKVYILTMKLYRNYIGVFFEKLGRQTMHDN